MKHFIIILILILSSLLQFKPVSAQTLTPEMLIGRWNPLNYCDSNGKEINKTTFKNGFSVFADKGKVFMGDDTVVLPCTFVLEKNTLKVSSPDESEPMIFRITGFQESEMIWGSPDNKVFIKLKKAESVILTEKNLEGKWECAGKIKDDGTVDESSCYPIMYSFSGNKKITASILNQNEEFDYEIFGPLIRIKNATKEQNHDSILVEKINATDMRVLINGAVYRYTRITANKPASE